MNIRPIRSFAHLADAIRAIASEHRPVDHPPMTQREVRQAAESFVEHRHALSDREAQRLADQIIAAHDKVTSPPTQDETLPRKGHPARDIVNAYAKSLGESLE